MTHHNFWLDKRFSFVKSHYCMLCLEFSGKGCDFSQGSMQISYHHSTIRRLRNSFFRSLSKFNLRKLQCIQNCAARVVSNSNRYTSITPIFKKLHWLPVEHRSLFKTAALIYKFLHTGFLKYFAPCLPFNSSAYSTRCSQSGGNFLVVPKFYPSTHKSVKQFRYSFAFNAPTVWNVLPDEIHASPSLASFRKKL